MAKGYTTRKQVENYLLITIEPWFYSQINDWIEAVEAHIEQVTGRVFIADETVSVRKYSGDGTNKLIIDDAVEIDSVTFNGTNHTSDESGATQPYVLEPANRLPVTLIEMLNQSFPRGKQNIEIGARWGYSENVPKDIQMSATILLAGIINFSLNADGEVQQMTIGAYSVTYKQEQKDDFENAKKTLESYRKYTF